MLATLEKYLKDPCNKIQEKFTWIIETANCVQSIVTILQKINKISNGKLGHFPEIFSYLEKALIITKQIRDDFGKSKNIWQTNNQSVFFMFMGCIDSLSKMYYGDENLDYTIGSLYEHLMELKEEQIENSDHKNSLLLELFQDRISAVVKEKENKPPLFYDLGPLIKVIQLTPKIIGFDDNLEKEEKQKNEMKRMKDKKKRMEKKMIREYAEDARVLENERKIYDGKLETQKERNLKKLKHELQHQAMLIKKEATTNYNSTRKKKVKGRKMAGNKTAQTQ